MGRARTRVVMGSYGNLRVQSEACSVSDRKEPHFCLGMKPVLQQNMRSKGFVMDTEVVRGKDRFRAIMYNPGSRKKQILLNWCPFCGSDLKRWVR